MRVPLQWLADYVDLDMSTDVLADRLTMIGLKVEAIERPSAGWNGIRVGHVIEVHPHPTSNKPLHVATVDTGEETVTVVTGAPNVTLGAKAPFVPVGASVPFGPDGRPLEIKPRPMAGIMSEGMLASARELGISDEHEGILVLPPDTPVGVPLASLMGGDVLDIETNPNRPDTLSIIGIAREVAAMTGQQITLPDVTVLGENVALLNEESIPVSVEAPDLCPRYTALRIEGVAAADSPLWLKTRLEAAGMRAISLLVDLTNYVMLEYGQPMHAFDAADLKGGRIVVRRARDGEVLRTLDGVERTLSPQNLVIADAERAVGVAGVMGGENSEISERTATVILESATFAAVPTRRSAKSLGLRTEASARFEKGLPPELTTEAAGRFVQLLAQITAAPLQVARLTDHWTGAPDTKRVTMPLGDVPRLIGIEVPGEEAAEVLSLLGFDVELGEDALTASVPFWRRVDIEQSVDLVEEVARLVGFDRVPATLPRRTMPPVPERPALHWDATVRAALWTVGIHEVETHSLVSPDFMARLFKSGGVGHDAAAAETWESIVPNLAGITEAGATTVPVRIANPATKDRQVLRLTLLPSVLDVVARNLKQGDERLAFFEVDRTFFWRSAQDLPLERRTLTIALSGHRRSRSWADGSPGPFTFYDIKGVMEAVLQTLQIRDCTVQPFEHVALHPGRAAQLLLAERAVGWFGELHPEVAHAHDITNWPVQVAEIDLDALYAVASDPQGFLAMPRFPAAYRDIAVVIDADVPASQVIGTVERFGGNTLEAARIFDVYEGDRVPAGKKSVAVEMAFRAAEGTLTQEQVAESMALITRALEERVGATLRD